MYFDIHTHNAQNYLDIQNCFHDSEPPKGYFSIGVHPCYIPENWEEIMDATYSKMKLSNCKAVGECGLDKNSNTPFDIQKDIFKRHIAYSETLKKPLIIHCVKSFSEIVQLKKKFDPKQTWIVHGFHKNEKVASLLLQNDIKLSFGKAILYDKTTQIVLSTTHKDNFFLETDDSDVSIEEIYKKASEIRRISLRELYRITYENYRKVFKFT